MEIQANTAILVPLRTKKSHSRLMASTAVKELSKKADFGGRTGEEGYATKKSNFETNYGVVLTLVKLH